MENRKQFIESVKNGAVFMAEIDENEPLPPYFFNFIQQQPNTVVVIQSIVDPTIAGIGFSKVSYPDRFDPEVGLEIAFNKAAANLWRETKLRREIMADVIETIQFEGPQTYEAAEA